jgi:hypothetical protein
LEDDALAFDPKTLEKKQPQSVSVEDDGETVQAGFSLGD